jgi:hypothetical protein
MKVGTYPTLTSRLLDVLLLVLVSTSAACGTRTALLQEEDAGTVTEDEGAQRSSSGGSGGRAGGPNLVRAGRGGSGGTGGMAGRSTGGRGARAGRGADDSGRGGAGASDGAAGSSDDNDDKPDEPKEDSGTAGEASGGSGGEQAGAGGEQAGTGGEQAGAGGEQAGAGGDGSGAAGADAAGSGGAGGDPGAGGQAAPVTGRMTQLTPEQTTELCGRIDMETAGLAWGEGIRGYCARRGLAQPDMCPATRDMCVDGPEIIPVCTQTAPDCPEVSIDEFVRCRRDVLTSFVEYNRQFTCESMQPLPLEPALGGCVTVYERCPAAQALRVE